MELKQEARSSDRRFIVRQRLLSDIPYGVRSSAENGCGWIAAYNFLIADGHPAKWDQVRRELQRVLTFKGKRGTNLWVLLAYLRQKGCRLHLSCTPGGIRALAETCRAGLLMYWTGKQCHFVTLQRQPDGTLRFLNVRPGMDDVVLTMEAFYRRCVRFPVVAGAFTK